MLALEHAVGFLVDLGLLERGDLILREHQAVLCRLRLLCLEALVHVLQIVPLPLVARLGRRHEIPRPRSKFATTASSITGATRFFNRGFERLISMSAASSPSSVQLLEPKEAVTTSVRHLAGMAHIAKLLGQLQQTYFGTNDLLLLGHPKAPFRSSQGTRQLTPTVRFSRSYSVFCLRSLNPEVNSPSRSRQSTVEMSSADATPRTPRHSGFRRRHRKALGTEPPQHLRQPQEHSRPTIVKSDLL